MAAAVASACASCATTSARLLVPDGTSLKQTFSAYPETRWFALTVEPGKTYVVEAADVDGDLTANAIGTLGVFAVDGVSAPPEATVDCTAANGPRPPAAAVAGDGIRCVVRTVPPSGTLLNKRPVYLKVTRMDPATGGGVQFKVRAREGTVYGRWLTAGYDYHVEVENTTGDATCVEVTRYPASGLAYTPGPGWTGTLMLVPADGAGLRRGEAGDSERQPGGCGRRGDIAHQRLRFADQPARGRAACEHVRVRPGGQPLHLFLHVDRERRQDAEHVVIRQAGISGKGRIMKARSVAAWAAGVVVASLGLMALPALGQGGAAGQHGGGQRAGDRAGRLVAAAEHRRRGDALVRVRDRAGEDLCGGGGGSVQRSGVEHDWRGERDRRQWGERALRDQRGLHGERAGAGAGGGGRWHPLHRADVPADGGQHAEQARDLCCGGVGVGPSFQIRVRESTIYGRWTTNGYDFHVELENTTADALCAQILFSLNAGDSYSGTW